MSDCKLQRVVARGDDHLREPYEFLLFFCGGIRGSMKGVGGPVKLAPKTTGTPNPAHVLPPVGVHTLSAQTGSPRSRKPLYTRAIRLPAVNSNLYLRAADKFEIADLMPAAR